mmetsp:Transcript_12129/g.22688  ORF Transcript_12129/g.22688 Transcript_12129/m.22688 type:complete len:510 (-) Transcript_12129:250-1779(-)
MEDGLVKLTSSYPGHTRDDTCEHTQSVRTANDRDEESASISLNMLVDGVSDAEFFASFALPDDELQEDGGDRYENTGACFEDSWHVVAKSQTLLQCSKKRRGFSQGHAYTEVQFIKRRAQQQRLRDRASKNLSRRKMRILLHDRKAWHLSHSHWASDLLARACLSDSEDVRANNDDETMSESTKSEDREDEESVGEDDESMSEHSDYEMFCTRCHFQVRTFGFAPHMPPCLCTEAQKRASKERMLGCRGEDEIWEEDELEDWEEIEEPAPGMLREVGQRSLSCAEWQICERGARGARNAQVVWLGRNKAVAVTGSSGGHRLLVSALLPEQIYVRPAISHLHSASEPPTQPVVPLGPFGSRGPSPVTAFPHSASPHFAFPHHRLSMNAAQAIHEIHTIEEARQWILDVSRIRELTPEDYEILLILDEDSRPHKDNAMSPDAIAALPCPSTTDWVHEECCICLCEMKEGEDVRTLFVCEHAFHFDCLKSWLSSNNHKSKCPLCGQACSIMS